MGRLPVTGGMGLWPMLAVSVVLLSSLAQPTDAQTQIGFEFREKYSSISHDVDSFGSALVDTITRQYNFSSTRNSVISRFDVTNGTDGRIRANLTLNIDTEDKFNVRRRDIFETSLRSSRFAVVLNSSVYQVDGTTVWFRVGFWDLWHELVADIVIAVFCGLAAFALFVASMHLVCMITNRKRNWRTAQRRATLPSQRTMNSIGRTNGGFVMDEINGGHRPHTPKSSIGSTRFVFEGDTVFDKLTFAGYEVPAKHMHSFL